MQHLLHRIGETPIPVYTRSSSEVRNERVHSDDRGVLSRGGPLQRRVHDIQVASFWSAHLLVIFRWRVQKR